MSVVRHGVVADPSPTWAGAGAAALVPTLALAAAGVAVLVATPDQGPGDTLLSRVVAGTYLVAYTALAVTGAVLLHRRPRALIARLLAGAGIAQLLSLAVMGYAALAAGQGGRLPAVLAWATNWVWVPAQVALLLVLLRFPDGRLPGPRWRVIEGLALLWGLATLLVTALAPGPLGHTALEHLDNPFGWAALRGIINPLLSGLFIALPVLNALAAAALVWRWRRSTAEDRQRLRWVGAAAVVALVAAPLVLLGTDSAEGPIALAVLLLSAAVAVAVLRTRLWELGVVARTVLSLGLTGGLLLTAYAAAVRWSAAEVVPPVAGLAVAVVALPLHALVRRGLDRFLLGTDGDPAAVSRDLRTQLRSGPLDTLRDTASRLAQTLRLPWVVFLGEDGTVLAASAAVGPKDTGTTTAVPLLVAGDQVGRLVAAERAPGEGLSPRDLRILTEVAQPAALLVRSVQVDARLAASHERLGGVRAEERARLQRDLHDGLGPVLGGITMHAEAARNLVGAGADPDRVTAQLDNIGTQAQGAIAEIRRLIQELRPSALGEAGLADALTDAVPAVAEGLHPILTLDLPGELDSRTEVAAYRIVVEAVRNAARHGEATTVHVDARVVGDDLVLTVTDDGRGLSDVAPGVGIRAMTERAAQLGGTLTMGRGPDGGTRVTARLPLVGGMT